MTIHQHADGGTEAGVMVSKLLQSVIFAPDLAFLKVVQVPLSTLQAKLDAAQTRPVCSGTRALVEHTKQQQQQQQGQQQQQQQPPGSKKQPAKKQRQSPSSLTPPQADAAACVRISTYIQMFTALASACGDALLTGPLGPHMELSVRLAWAVLRCKDGSRKTRGSSMMCSTAEEYARGAFTGATMAAIGLTGSLAKELSEDYQHDMQLPRLVDAAAGGALYYLLLANLGLHAMALQEAVGEQGSKKQMMPQHHHTLLLRELGIEWVEACLLRKRTSIALSNAAAAMVALRHRMNLAAAVHNDDGRGSSSSSSSSSSSRSSSSSTCGTLEAAAMLTILQEAVLVSAGCGDPWFQHYQDLAGILDALEGFLVNLKGSAREAAAAVLLQPVLTQLLPARLEALKAAVQAAAGSSNAVTQGVPAEHDMCLLYITGALHVLLGTGAAAAQLQEAYLSHPQQASRSAALHTAGTACVAVQR
ncbi:hypothetical protein OEZ85_004737 [Tetradesmus obliquus]|uniref:Wings apart-like protein C-terminal domain-containing protein n=1 Tax=Tetradesmus obliquus TaxID=3088 RepID=A0ABY8ULU8_TETOB|nr:hypothetical protein OEZ85_004737 [Tetradesmus obliquus]